MIKLIICCLVLIIGSAEVGPDRDMKFHQVVMKIVSYDSMMTPYFQMFSIGLRHTHTLSPGSKFTTWFWLGCLRVVVQQPILDCCYVQQADWKQVYDQKIIQLDSTWISYNKCVVRCTSIPNRKLSFHIE